MRNSVESLLRESYSLNRLKAARVMHCKVFFILYLNSKIILPLSSYSL